MRNTAEAFKRKRGRVDSRLELDCVSVKGIVDRIQAGHADAEAELVARFQGRIQAFLGARTSNTDFIEEVTQETMLAAICAVREGKLREPDQLSGFVYGIARNQLADAIRRRSREKVEPLAENQDFPAPASESEPELMESARREIASMDSVDRRILWMTLIDGFKPGEIAATVGMNADAVRQRKSRALKRLIEKLKPASRTVPPGPLPDVRPR